MNVAVAVLVVYFVAMAGIGVWAMRRSSGSTEDYLLGGRSLGPAVTALRLQSSSMSGYMFLGAGSLGYTQGYFGLWYALGDLGGGILNLSILGRRMRKLSQILGSVSSIEYLEDRYQSPWVRIVAAPIALGALFLYVLAQFVAGGKSLAAVAGINYPLALTIAIGVIVLYTFLGGYLAVAYTDFMQAIIMVVGMVWILVATLMSVGGLGSGNQKVGEINPNLLTMWGSDLQFRGEWGTIIGAVLLFSIGYLGWPHVVVSHMAMKRPSVARGASIYSMIFNLLFIPAPYLIGTMAILILPGLANPEEAVFGVAQAVLPSFAVGIVMAAVMAAIMSTADALLLQVSTIASQDIFARFLVKDMDEKKMVQISRFMVLTLAALGLALAIWQPPTVFGLVVYATTILGSSFVPAYVCAVWWSKANWVGAVASMLVGAMVSVLWVRVGLDVSLHLDAMVAGLVSSTLAMIFGSLLTQRTHPVSPEIKSAMAQL